MNIMRSPLKTILAVYVITHFFLLTPQLHAGPISYEGGWMFITENQANSINWQVSYSLKPWISIGGVYAYDRMDHNLIDSKQYGLLRTNFLLKRWNEMESQGNLYLFGAAGGVKAADINGSAWLGGIEADWETRKVYTSAKIKFQDSDKFESKTMYQARLGVAPYLTKFENLHTWVILQVQYLPDAMEEKLNVTPLMRFYIDNVLWELGVSSRGTWLFNSMVHF